MERYLFVLICVGIVKKELERKIEMKKPKRTMSDAHKMKLSQRAQERKRAKLEGIRLPTRAEEREAALQKKKPITEQSVRELVADIPKPENTRQDVPAFFRPETSTIKHPRFRNTSAMLANR